MLFNTPETLVDRSIISEELGRFLKRPALDVRLVRSIVYMHMTKCLRYSVGII
jgi:hypothetical protein